MENIITGAKTLLVNINNTGKNFLPYSEELKDRIIRYIDVVPMDMLPDSDGDVFTDFTSAYLSLADYNGNAYMSYNVPLERYNPITNGGVRIPINKKISLQNSYIAVPSSTEVGNTVVMVVYYEDEMYSYPNSTYDLAVDSFEVKIKSLDFNNPLPDNRTLVNKRIRGLALPIVPVTPSYTPCINANVPLGFGYITLQKNNYVILDHMPLMLFLEPYYLKSLVLRNIEFDLVNSYVTIGGSTAKFNAVYGEAAAALIEEFLAGSFFINVLYENQ